MKKQLVSILFALCMVLCLVPLAAFAEGETENVRAVTDQTTLFAAVADPTVTTVKLTADIDIDATLTVSREVKLDLNGFVLKYQNDSARGSVIKVASGGNLTLTDSDAEKVHKFDKSVMPWTLATDTTAEENIVDVLGGIITGGTGTVVYANSSCGGGVYVAADSSGSGTFTMTGGSIVGCTANWCGAGIFVDKYDVDYAQFTMSSGLIAGCLADGRGTVSAYGGGIYNIGKTELSGSAKIQACNAVGAQLYNDGGGIYNGGEGSMTISGNVTVIDCDVAGQSNVMNITGFCNISGGTFYGNISGNLSYVQDSAKVDVTFSTNGGSSVDTQKVLRGQKATTPTAPTKAGYTFDKWYNGTEVYDFNQPVTEPITLTAKWLTGEGTAASPILISNAEELKIFHDIVNGENNRQQNLAACATLTADIVLNDGTFDEDGNYTPGPSGAALTEWTPMGNQYRIAAYSGTFDGAGHTIQGLYCAATKNIVGLFGYTNGAVIKDVKVTGYLRVIGDFVGSIVASAGSTSITGCVNAAVINASGISSYYAGGIVASAHNTSTIRDCVNIGTLTCSIPSDNAEGAGGIAGCLTGNSVISNCSNLGIIMGICSNARYSGTNNIGGIAGSTWGATISDCYNVGLLTDTTNQTSARRPYVGGIAGYSESVISNSYSVGSVTATRTDAPLGGIAGYSAGGSITNCYYLTGTAGQVYGNGTATVTNTTEKSAFDFANGGVLALLMADRPADVQPWDTTCKYLESAGLTLPVLASQKLTVHDHVWSTYTTDAAAKTHTHSCACGVAETEACTITPTTCKDGSACAVCGQQYGGPDTGKHADLQHFPAVAATTDAEGNKEYWYCGGCGKYFADAAAAREITRADTVTAKLPQPTTPPTATPTASPTAQPTTAPQAAEQPRRTAQPTVQPTAAPTVQPVSTIPATGDASSPILWAALLLCSGAVLAVTAYKKNRHRS